MTQIPLDDIAEFYGSHIAECMHARGKEWRSVAHPAALRIAVLCPEVEKRAYEICLELQPYDSTGRVAMSSVSRLAEQSRKKAMAR